MQPVFHQADVFGRAMARGAGDGGQFEGGADFEEVFVKAPVRRGVKMPGEDLAVEKFQRLLGETRVPTLGRASTRPLASRVLTASRKPCGRRRRFPS